MTTDHNTQIKGNASLSRNASIGGNILTGGNLTVKGRLSVEGWLDAPNVKAACKGLFATAEALDEAYPTPRAGWWAMVGNTIPAEIYRSDGHHWQPTGETGGSIEIDLNRYDNRIDALQDTVLSMSDRIDSIQHPISVKDCISDLVLADEDENPIATFAGGHVITANFDSSTVMTPDDLPFTVRDADRADLILAADDGSPIATFAGGHIKTANFDSAAINASTETPLPYQGKRLSIIGDSISTFQGHLPTGYATFYPQGNIQSVQHTWWWQWAKLMGMSLLRNCSWSGSKLSGDSTDITGVVGCGDGRVVHLADGDTVPDIVVIMIGINDFQQSVPLGSWTARSGLNNTGTIDNFSEAYALLLKKIRTAYPAAEIMCCTLLDIKTGNGTWPRTNGNGCVVEDFNEAIRRVAHAMGARVLEAHSSGISFFNYASYFMDGIHPNAAGAKRLAEGLKI